MADPKKSESQQFIRESKIAGEVLRARIWENYEKANLDFTQRYDRNLEALAKEQTPWVKVPAAQLKRLWFDFNESKVVADKKGLEEVAECLLEGIARQRAAVELQGQTDAGLSKLEKLYANIYGAPTAEEKLTRINTALRIIQERSDLAENFVEGGSRTLAALLKETGPDDVDPKDYTVGAHWDYLVVYRRESGQTYYFNLDLYDEGRAAHTSVASPWVAEMGGGTRFKQEDAQQWVKYWQGVDFDDRAKQYDLIPVMGYSETVQENEEEEFEEVDPDMPVDSKGFLLNLDQRGRERMDELARVSKWPKSGEWHIPYTSTGNYSDFYAEANYKYFKEKYPFLNQQSQQLGFDTGTFPDEYDTFEMFLSQIDQSDWESFIEDVTAVNEGLCVDEDEAFKLEQAETDRYIREDFLPELVAELKEQPRFYDSFYQFLISQITPDKAYDLMRGQESYPEPQGEGTVYLRVEEFAKHVDVDDLQELFEGEPVQQQWEAKKLEFYELEEGALFNQYLAEAVALIPAAQHAHSLLTSEDAFLLLKSVVPDSNFGSDLPCWDEIKVGPATVDEKAPVRWVVTHSIPKLDSTNYWRQYVVKGVQEAAQLAAQALPTWSRQVQDHPELRLGEALDPDAVDPAQYLDSVKSYWGIAHTGKRSKPIWYTGNPWDRWSFEIHDAKQFKSKEAAESFIVTFEKDFNKKIVATRLPDLYQEDADPDAVDPKKYLAGLKRKYVARFNDRRILRNPDGSHRGVEDVSLWFSDNPFGWWPDRSKAKVYNSPKEMYEVYLGLPDFKRKAVVIEPAEIVSEARDPDSVNAKDYLKHLSRGFIVKFVMEPVEDDEQELVMYYSGDDANPWITDRANAREFQTKAEAEALVGRADPHGIAPQNISIEPVVQLGVHEARKRDSDLPPDEDIDYRSWFKHGGYDSGRELYSDADVRIFLPSTEHTLEKYGIPLRNASHEEWDRIVEPGPIFLIIPTSGVAWAIREWYDEIREIGKDGRQWTVYPDEIVKTHPQGQKVGAVLAKYFKKKLKKDFDKYFKLAFQFGGLTAVRGYLKNVKVGANPELDSAIGIAAALEGNLDMAAKFWEYPRELLDKKGAWIYYDDYNDLANLFNDNDRHRSHREAAIKVFSNETYDWFDFLWGQDYPAKDITGYLTPQHYVQLRKALIGRSILIDGEPVTLTSETLKQFSDADIRDWLDDHEDFQDGGDLEDIVEALSQATKRALETLYSDAYFKGYLATVTDALSSEYKWVKVGGEDKLAFFVSWQTIREMIVKYAEDNNEPYQGSLNDLPESALKLEAHEEYHASLDDDKSVVVDSIDNELAELEPKRAPRDPTQPELFDAPPAEPPPLGESGPDDVGAKEFIRGMPMRYVITNEWESPTRGVQIDYWAGQRGWTPELERAHKYTSYDQVKQEYDRMMRGDVTSEFREKTHIKPVYESVDPDEIDHRKYLRNFNHDYVIRIDRAIDGHVMWVQPDTQWRDDVFRAFHFNKQTGEDFIKSLATLLEINGATATLELAPMSEALDPDAVDARQFVSGLNPQYVIAHRWQPINPRTEYLSHTGAWVSIDRAEHFPSREKAEKALAHVFRDSDASDSSTRFKAQTWIEAVVPAVHEAVLQESLLMEGYKFAVTLIPLPREIADFVAVWGEANIPNEWLYVGEDGDKGREKEPHVTVLYGITTNDVPDELRQICATTRPFPIFFEKVTVFNTNPDYDVLKIDIESPWLHELHKRIKATVPNESKFPEYHPHCTLAYVKKGVADKLVGTDMFAGGVQKPQFTAMGMLFKGAAEDSDDPNRTKESLLFSTVKKPQVKEAADPDDVNPRDYLNQVPIDACNRCGQDFGKPYSIRRDYVNREGDVIACLGHMTKEGYFEPDHRIEQDLTGYDLRHDSDFCDTCGCSLLRESLSEAGPDDIDPRDYVKQMPLYYIVKGKMKPEFVDNLDGDAKEQLSQNFYFDTAGGTRTEPHRMTHSRALKVVEFVKQDYPWFDAGAFPAEDQSQMYWQGRRTPQEIGETEDPDALEPKDYMQGVPVQYVIKKTGSSERHKSAGIGWFWNDKWGWRTALAGASRYPNRVEADDMIRERGLQGYAQVEPLINESQSGPFDRVPFPTDTSQLIRFLRCKRPAPQLL